MLNIYMYMYEVLLWQLLVALQLDGKVRLPDSEFDCEETRYNHRFAPFGVLVTPPPVHYSQFKVLLHLLQWIDAITSLKRVALIAAFCRT